MKKLILALLLGTATNAFACEWKLTVQNMITNELKYYQVNKEMRFVDLDDSISKKQIKCFYAVYDITKEVKDVKKAENAYVGCVSNEYVHQTKSARIELNDGHIIKNLANHEIVNIKDKLQLLYQLHLDCE